MMTAVEPQAILKELRRLVHRLTWWMSEIFYPRWIFTATFFRRMRLTTCIGSCRAKARGTPLVLL
jgi:hypothetical protein